MNTNSTASLRLWILDGWRGASIILVLASHLLPLGPSHWNLNATAGPMGMALFFTLSGFLITRFFLLGANVGDFIIRRLFRIIPLAWLGMVISIAMSNGNGQTYLANLLFYANLPPQHLTDVGSHFWSLCIEVQFYVGIALLISVFGIRALPLLTALSFAVTFHRIFMNAPVDIVSWRRGDEILAGCLLAMAYENQKIRSALSRDLPSSIFPILFILFCAACHPAFEALNYARPYIAAALVCSTLVQPLPRYLSFMTSHPIRYTANISFALYVTHHILVYTWLGRGDSMERYMKRPILFFTAILLSHLSTFYYEAYFIRTGHRIAKRFFPSPPKTVIVNGPAEQ